MKYSVQLVQNVFGVVRFACQLTFKMCHEPFKVPLLCKDRGINEL